MKDDWRSEPDEGRESAPQSKPFSQDFSHQPVAARVPDGVSRGTFTTGVMVLQSHEEFAIDFLSTMAQPHQIVARVIMTPATFSQLVAALGDNRAKYEKQFGRLVPRPGPVRGPSEADKPVAQAPAPGDGASPAAEGQPSNQAAEPSCPMGIADVYDQLKLPDELLGGCYANVVMIRHTAEEFVLDFVASFYPRAVVTSRIYVAAGRLASILDALADSLAKYRQRNPQPPPPGGNGSSR